MPLFNNLISCLYHAIYITETLQHNLKFGVELPPEQIFLLIRMFLTILGIFCFHIKFKTFFSISDVCASGDRILVGWPLSYYQSYQSRSIDEIFPYSGISSNCFSVCVCVFKFLFYKFFISLVRFLPQSVICNRNATYLCHFCLLLLY